MTGPVVLPRGLGWRTQLGQQDSAVTGLINPYLPGTGWVVIFAPEDLDVADTEFECYHIALDGPVGSTAVVLIDGHQWDYVNQAWSNGWDPAEPMLIRSGQTVQLCWNRAFTAAPYNRTTNVQPTVTLWLRRST